MAKCYSIIIFIAITLALVSCEPPRFKQSKRLGNLRIQSGRKLFARQQEVPSIAPYPPAGVTPEIPFDLPTETETTLVESDHTYGPPELIPAGNYLPPELTPDQSYGPPEVEDVPPITEPHNTYIPVPAGAQPAIEEPEYEELSSPKGNSLSENLMQRRNRFRTRSRSAQLHSQPIL